MGPTVKNARPRNRTASRESTYVTTESLVEWSAADGQQVKTLIENAVPYRLELPTAMQNGVKIYQIIPQNIFLNGAAIY